VVVKVVENAPEPWVKPVKPEMAPAAETSHDVVSIVTVEELLPKVVTPVEERVVKAPVPGVVAPIETKLAAPAAVIFQLLSVIETPVEAVSPIVMVSAPALPRIIVSAPVEPKVMVVAEVASREVPLTVRLPAIVALPALVSEKRSVPPEVSKTTKFEV